MSEEQEKSLIPQANQKLDRPAPTADSVARSLAQFPSLQEGIQTFGKKAREEELQLLAQLGADYQKGTLPIPTTTSLLKAQIETRETAKQSPTRRTNTMQPLSPIQKATQEGIQALIAHHTQNGIPESSPLLAYRIGRHLNELIRHLGEDIDANEELMLTAVEHLPELQQRVLWHMVGTARKLELGFPDLAYCAPKEAAEYMSTIAYLKHGSEVASKKRFEDINVQINLLGEVIEALITRDNDPTETPIDFREVMEALLHPDADSEYPEESGALAPVPEDTLIRLIAIALDQDYIQDLYQILDAHPMTRAMARNITQRTRHDTASDLAQPYHPLGRREWSDGYGEEDQS